MRLGLALTIALFTSCGGVAEAQDCSQFLAAKANAARAGDLALLYALDAQEKQCLAQGSYAPQPQPYQPPPPPINSYLNSPIFHELAALGGMINRNAVLPQGVPLSNGLVMMQNQIAPPPAPQNYVDPFAAPPSRPVVTAPAPRTYGSIWDPNQAVTLQPPTPAVPNSQGFSAPTFTNPNGCTFNSPSCE